MGRIIQKNNGMTTIFTSGEDISLITGQPDTYVLGIDPNTGLYEKLNPDGVTVDLEKDSSGITGGTLSGTTLILDNSGGGNINISLSGLSTGGGISSNLYEVTYSGLTTHISNSTLSGGSYYMVTDFQTIYDQPDYFIDGNPKGVGSIVTYTGGTEPIIVLATSENTLSIDAYQPTYPKDKIKYDWSFASTEITSTPTYGRISERIDEYENRTDYDHRTINFVRYQGYETGTTLTGTINEYDCTTGVMLGNGTLFSTELSAGSTILLDTKNTFGYQVGVSVVNIIDDTTMDVVIDSGYTSTVFTVGNGYDFTFHTLNATGNYYDYKEVYVGQRNEGDYYEFATFILDGGSLSNYIGNNNSNSGFLLANNVFGSNSYSNTIGNYFGSNTIGNNFNSNTIEYNFGSNTITNNFGYNKIATYFNNNTIGSDFGYGGSQAQGNVIGDGFYNNIIGQYCYNNVIGNFFTDNIIGLEFENNQIQNYFIGNTIGNNFESNQIGNYFGNDGTSNTIADNFNNNKIGNYFGNDGSNDGGNNIGQDFFGNLIGNYFYLNTIGDNSYSNTIGNYFTSNTIGYNFTSNTIGNDSYSNTIGNGFTSNTIGNASYSNTIGNGFGSNTIGNDFYSNTIGNYFGSNKIKTQISSVDFTDFYGNITGFTYSATGSTASDNIYVGLSQDSTTGDGVNATFDIEVSGGTVIGVTGNTQGKLYVISEELTILGNQIGGPDGVDDVIITVTGISQLPSVYESYTCDIFERQGGTKRLSYYDSSDILTITNINE